MILRDKRHLDLNKYRGKMEINSFKDLNELIHLRNLIAKYKDVNLKTIQKAICPEVGFFWVDVADKKVYGKSINFNEGELLSSETSKHLVHPDEGHYYAWNDITKQNPKWEGMQYEDIPRGRVVFFLLPSVKRCEFRIYMCPLLKTKDCEELVREKYNLPENYHRFFYDDEHYFLNE